MGKIRGLWVLLILLCVLVIAWSPAKGSPPQTRVPAPGSVKSEHFNTSDTLTLRMPSIELLSDRLVVASGYAGFDTTLQLSGVDSVWVSCPIIEDDDIEWKEGSWLGPRPKRILIFLTAYNEERTHVPGSSYGPYVFIAGPVYGPSTSPYGEGGFYVRRKSASTMVRGFFWLVLKIKEPS